MTIQNIHILTRVETHLGKTNTAIITFWPRPDGMVVVRKEINGKPAPVRQLNPKKRVYVLEVAREIYRQESKGAKRSQINPFGVKV